jgi:hypothetical protein
VRDVRKDKMILNKVLKTKEIKFPNLELMKEDRMKDEKREKINQYKKKVTLDEGILPATSSLQTDDSN